VTLIIAGRERVVLKTSRDGKSSPRKQEWWRSEPDPEVVKLAADKLIALDNERRGFAGEIIGR